MRGSSSDYLAYGRVRLPKTFVKFLIVGAIGYVVNQLTLFVAYDTALVWFLPEAGTRVDLFLFTHSDVRLFIASVVAVEAAIVSNFTWHERWTFRHRHQSGRGAVRFLRFNTTSIGSPVISVATVNVLTPVFGISPYIANTLGIGLGTMWNWLWNTQVIWPVKR